MSVGLVRPAQGMVVEMTPMLISLPDWHRERLRQIAEHKGVGVNELIEQWVVERTEEVSDDEAYPLA
jgi:hypothetical protein